MRNDDSPGHKTRARRTIASLDNCPVCGEPIDGITAHGPGEHQIAPCGHALGARARADGGTVADLVIVTDEQLRQVRDEGMATIETTSRTIALIHEDGREQALAALADNDTDVSFEEVTNRA